MSRTFVAVGRRCSVRGRSPAPELRLEVELTLLDEAEYTGDGLLRLARPLSRFCWFSPNRFFFHFWRLLMGVISCLEGLTLCRNRFGDGDRDRDIPPWELRREMKEFVGDAERDLERCGRRFSGIELQFNIWLGPRRVQLKKFYGFREKPQDEGGERNTDLFGFWSSCGFHSPRCLSLFFHFLPLCFPCRLPRL